MAQSDISGFVLAGGKSRRMGRDKAQIAWRDGTLLSDAIERLRAISDRVFVVGDVQLEGVGVKILHDLVGSGPLAGIHAALSATETPWNVVLGVDLPLISTAFLRWMSEICLSEDHKNATVPRIQDEFQPLCAAYHRDFLPVCTAALARNQFSIHDLFRFTPTRIMEEDEIRAAGFNAESFLNVNTPEDLARAAALARR